MTHTSRILTDLADGEWVCGSHWYGSYIPTFSQRISDLNHKEPGRIESRVCRAHGHSSTIHEYRDTLALRMAWA